MTDQQIMAIAHEDLVRLFVLRRDDLRAASKEAARLAMNERRRNDPEYRAYHAEYYRNWREANKERRKAYKKQWTAANREKTREYLRRCREKRALEKQPADISESTSLQVNKSASQRVHKPERTSSGAMPIPDFELTQVRTDSEAAAYWRQVIDDLECRFHAKEIEVEAYFGGRNAAMSHMLAAEERMKPRRLRNY